MQELKNSSSSHDRGLCCELIALNHYKKKNYQLLHFRKKYLGVELDFLLQRKSQLLALEVKSIGDENRIGDRLSYTQKQRLQRVFEHLIHKYPDYEVDFKLVLVNLENKIREYEIDWERRW